MAVSCAAVLQRSCCAVAPPQCSMKEPLPALLTTLVYDGMDAACTASTESTSLLHHHAWHTVRGAEKLRRTNGCSRTARAACSAAGLDLLCGGPVRECYAAPLFVVMLPPLLRGLMVRYDGC